MAKLVKLCLGLVRGRSCPRPCFVVRWVPRGPSCPLCLARGGGGTMAKLPLGVSVNASLLWQAEEGTAERVLRSQSVRARRKHPNAHFQAGKTSVPRLKESGSVAAPFCEVQPVASRRKLISSTFKFTVLILFQPWNVSRRPSAAVGRRAGDEELRAAVLLVFVRGNRTSQNKILECGKN